MIELLTAKNNVEQILGVTEKEKSGHPCRDGKLFLVPQTKRAGGLFWP